jgi:hypothetical protein
MEPRAGFEPATPALPRRRAHPVNWPAFREYLDKTYRHGTASERYNYASRYGHCLLEQNLSDLQGLSDDKRNHAMKALSALARFLGFYDSWRTLVKDYGLKWTGKSADEIVINRLTKIVDPEEVFTWVKQVKRARPQLTYLIDLTAISGLRLVEAVESYNLIIRLAREGNLGQYYNAESGTLEHYRFKKLFIRRTKKAFISFIPENFVEKISGANRLASARSVLKLIRRRGLKSRFGDLREMHGSYATKYLRDAEIDFLQGRVTANVFMRNYFNPALINDLKQRAFKAIDDILGKIS